MKPIRVGLVGLGTVGGGTVEVLRRNREEIARRAGRDIVVRMASAKDLSKPRAVNLEGIELVADPMKVVRHSEVDIVVELVGGDTTALALVRTAIEGGKHAARNIERRQRPGRRNDADMRVIDDDEVVLPRQVLDGKALEILQRPLVPDDFDARALLPLGRSRKHRVVATRMAPGHATQGHGHRPNSARISLLCSPMRGTARPNAEPTPVPGSCPTIAAPLDSLRSVRPR